VVLDNDDEYNDDLYGIAQSNTLLKSFPEKKHTGFFSKIYKDVSMKDIMPSVGKIMMNNDKSIKAFAKLNAIANLDKGTETLKGNGALIGALKVILMADTFKPEVRVAAAKLQTRLFGVPTTIQKTQLKDGKKFKDITSYVIVPRIQRIYRPDYYIENYKAGNWEP
jgi:hypothetical protein